MYGRIGQMRGNFATDIENKNKFCSNQQALILDSVLHNLQVVAHSYKVPNVLYNRFHQTNHMPLSDTRRARQNSNRLMKRAPTSLHKPVGGLSKIANGS